MVPYRLSVQAQIGLHMGYIFPHGASKASSRLDFHEVDQFEVEENILTLHTVYFTPMADVKKCTKM